MGLKYQAAGWINLMGYVCVMTSACILSYTVPESLVFPTYLITSVLLGILNIIDSFISDNFSKNYKIMKKSGLSELEIWSSALLTTFGFQIPTILILKYVFGHSNSDWIVLSWEEHFSLHKILLSILSVWTTDCCFYYTHQLLHEKFPRIHLLHHCCVYSSMSTNAFFHPLDLVMEFTAPGTMVALISKHIFKDPWMYVLGSAIMLTWYALSHDELLRFDHVNHHRHCAPGYFIYHNVFYSYPKKEQVRYGISELQNKKTRNGTEEPKKAE